MTFCGLTANLFPSKNSGTTFFIIFNEPLMSAFSLFFKNKCKKHLQIKNKGLYLYS